MQSGRPARGPLAGPRVWLRLLVGFLLLQLVGVQLWPALHHALFKHAVCAEHGELVHVSQHTAHSATEPSKGAAVSSTAEDDDAHDHCQLPPGRHEPAAEPAEPTRVVSSSVSIEPPTAGASEQQPSSIPLLALAPKQSPPC